MKGKWTLSGAGGGEGRAATAAVVVTAASINNNRSTSTGLGAEVAAAAAAVASVGVVASLPRKTCAIDWVVLKQLEQLQHVERVFMQCWLLGSRFPSQTNSATPELES